MKSQNRIVKVKYGQNKGFLAVGEKPTRQHVSCLLGQDPDGEASVDIDHFCRVEPGTTIQKNNIDALN